VSTDYTIYNCPITEIPVADGYFDRVGSLAGLHHVKNKLPFFREVARVLKPDGVIAVGDVLADSTVARFLNGPVDRYTASGHRGIFIRHGDFPGWFERSGIELVIEEYSQFHWSFDSVRQMVDYCQHLFGMVKASKRQVNDALHEHFDIQRDGDKVMLPWALLYSVGKRRST
jgi:ubiquinone/menaquinone biosynthesis C-methylase UbiE